MLPLLLFCFGDANSFAFLHRAVVAGSFVFWVDNYDSMFRTRFANIKSNSFRDCHWTGIAVRKHLGNVAMNVIRDNANVIVPAMPPDPLVYAGRVVQMLLLGSIGTLNGNGVNVTDVPDLYSASLMMTWGVDRVPLKPSIRNPNVPQMYRDAIRRAPDSLGNFYALGMSGENIGSNLGLARVMRQFYDQYGFGNDTGDRYYALSMDMNIHKRTMRVCHSFLILFCSFCTSEYSRSPCSSCTTSQMGGHSSEST